MNMLDAANVAIEQAPGRAVRVLLPDGRRFDDVAFVRLFPRSDPSRYISVCRKQGGEPVEIGVIKDLKDLPGAVQTLIADDIRKRYFVPLITDIVSIKTRRGEDAWTVVTDRGPAAFVVRERGENVASDDHGAVTITDVDKCRYRIADAGALPPKSRALLETVLM